MNELKELTVVPLSLGAEPPAWVVRVGKLDTIAAVRKELRRLYRAARRAAGPDSDALAASKLAYLLNSIGRSLEGAELGKRIERLEKRAESFR
jgi:hypothetical protein